MPTDFETQLAFGSEGEHLVARWLLRRGNTVAPLYQYTNHDQAPVILWEEGGRAIKVTLPDLHCYNAGVAYFAEVKRKNQWWNNRELGCLETGTNLRLWRHYLAVANQTGCPVYLFFLHESMEPTGLFAGEISKLDALGPRQWRGGKTPLVFARRQWLTKYSELCDLEEWLPRAATQ